ncbi:fluoride efflux transporter CrcB [Oceanithermus sp.]|uniref:fluoride efflux transporter CrcB n=1 Tax=Oceanithermus sp. TaxID=2268145 RepID=UPI0025803E65|nr:fluoride efflux transporter CrcB [Oceanithermus sp.]
MERWIWIMAGGALGALGRYWVSGWVQQWAGSSFPWGTVGVNLIGSFLLGFVIQASLIGGWTGELRLFVAVGFLGAFTTFSTFAFEALELLRAGQGVEALAYVGLNLVLGVLLVALGMAAVAALRSA